MNIRLLRHATTVIQYGGLKILVDPMLNPAGAANPIPTKSPGKGRRNPLVDLPVTRDDLKAIFSSLDAILITHMHADHFDDFEGKMLPKDLPMLCQAEDRERLEAIGFRQVIPIDKTLNWSGLKITRYEACHGGFYWRRKMGKGAGYVLEAQGEPVFYIAGDTVWSPPVRQALAQHNPGIILVYAGAAQFPFGRSITMNTRDITQVCRNAPQAQIVAVHMEAINHCLLTREMLRDFLKGKPFSPRVHIPQNGEIIELR